MWQIPWRGGAAVLSVARSSWRRVASVLVDGEVVVETIKPTLDNPWIECQLPNTDPPIVVVQFQPQRYWYKTLVFVDGVCVDDGLTLDAWRAKKPVAMDRFEQGFRGPLWGPTAAIGLGIIFALPFLAQFVKTSNPPSLLGAVAGFMVGTGWLSAVILLVRWLRTKRSWPWRLRRSLVVFALLGVPVLLVLVAQATLPNK